MARNKSKRTKANANNYQDRTMKREYGKGEKFGEARISKEKLGKDNDASWYTKNSQLMRDVASYSYYAALGTPLQLQKLLPAGYVQSNTFATVPGILTLQLFPTPGISVDASSALNIAAQNAYSFVRYKNSGRANYDAPDLMLYYIAMDSLYSAWNWMKRIYGEASQYNIFNRYYAKAQVDSEYVDFENIIANLADFRAYINKTAAQITAFCVPATMSYMLRHSWAYSNVYKDADISKAQMYKYVPGAFYQYDETSSPNGGVLSIVKVCSGRDLSHKMQLYDIMSIVDGMLNALMYSEDIGIMSGDVLKAYGEGNLFKLSPISEDYTVSPVYSAEVLSQFENARIHTLDFSNSAYPVSNFNITQDPNTNWLKFNPKFQCNNDIPLQGAVINMHMESPSPDQTMVATRLTTPVNLVKSGDTSYYTFSSLGSDFVSQGTIFFYTGGGTKTVRSTVSYANLTLAELKFYNTVPISTGSNASDNGRLLEGIQTAALLETFDWAPMCFAVSTELGSGDAYVAGMFADLATYTMVTQDNLDMMNSAAILSMFDVPNGSSF